MKALKMTKWHSLAMAAALCCGAFSGTSHAADAAAVFVCGGGACNASLMQQLAQALAP